MRRIAYLALTVGGATTREMFIAGWLDRDVARSLLDVDAAATTCVCAHAQESARSGNSVPRASLGTTMTGNG